LRCLTISRRQRREACEIPQIITHLVFYSGWANAMLGLAVAKDVFAAWDRSVRSGPWTNASARRNR
jgi:hypothetical protein